MTFGVAYQHKKKKRKQKKKNKKKRQEKKKKPNRKPPASYIGFGGTGFSQIDKIPVVQMCSVW